VVEPVIVTVTLNPAVDVTYRVASVELGEACRVSNVSERAGGKGINVSRVLSIMGRPTLATGLLGGERGQSIADELTNDDIPNAFWVICGASRRTTTLVEDSGRATQLSEPGPEVDADEWQGFLAQLGDQLGSAEVLVISGSLPRGVPNGAYAHLVTLASTRGIPTVLDAHGSTILDALGARPSAVKPNADELRQATGFSDPQIAARMLQAWGASSVFASLGPDGMLAVDGGTVLRLWPPQCVVRNPTGAGDAAVAAIACGLAESVPAATILRKAVAWSAAAVAQPLAGVVDPATVAAHLRILPDPLELS
jgi:tagatose 6-phosphate kinase